MITCKSAVDLLVEYLDGELDAATHQALEAHLGACPECVPLVDGYRNVGRASRELLAAELPGACAERLSSFLRERMNRR